MQRRRLQRRQLLRAVGVATSTLLAGCLVGESEEFNLQIADQDFGEDADGKLVVNVTISNPGNQAQNGTLYVTSTVNGEETVRLREVSLEAHETKRVSVTYDVTYRNITEFSMQTDIQPSE